MSDLLKRAHEAKKLANDQSLPKWQRVEQALQAFSGLELTGMSAELSEPLEADLALVNRVLAKYRLERCEDYQGISNVDLQRMFGYIDGLTSWVMAAELERIIDALRDGVGKLPVEAIREAREHRELIVPELIEVVRNAASAARSGNEPDGNAHFFAIFLLSELQAKEALPVILDAFSLPGQLPFDLFGDVVTSTLGRVLAQFAGDRPEVMDALIANQALNEYVRWKAAQTYVYLVRDGRLQRDEAVRRLRGHLRTAVDRNDDAIASGLVCVLTCFAPNEALEDIKETYHRDLVDSLLVCIEDVEQSIAEGESRVRKELDRCRPTGIEDTIEELRHWAAFQEKPVPRAAPPPPMPHFATAPPPAEPPTTPVLSRGTKIGRNDPCICGSGKKFKKCCGARGKTKE